MTNFAFFIGEPQKFKEGIWIYPPKVKDVMTNENFAIYKQIFTLEQEDIADGLKKDRNAKNIRIPTPFEFLLANSYNHKDYEKLVKEAFKFFTHQEIIFLYEQKKIIVGKISQQIQKVDSIDQLITLSEEDFFAFQNKIRLACGDQEVLLPEQPNPNEDPRITRMKQKARERDRIKRKQKPKDGILLETTLVAICCMGIGITPLNIGEMSYAAVSPLMSMLQDKEKYDLDIRSLLAGGDSKKIKPKYWIKNPEK